MQVMSTLQVYPEYNLLFFNPDAKVYSILFFYSILEVYAGATMVESNKYPNFLWIAEEGN